MRLKQGYLVILSAPSGTGKTTICKKLLEINKDWTYSISATTREKRDNEKEGVDYFFMPKEKFDHQVRFGDFLESEWVHGNQYGTPVGPIEDALDNNKVMLFDMDVKGGFNLKEEFEDQAISIFIEPPGEEIPDKILVLEERLIKRGNENATLIKQRLKRFETEMSFKEKFDYHFTNDNLKKIVLDIDETIKRKIK